MTFLTLQTRVANEVGLSLSDATDLAMIKSWINAAYKAVCGAYNWPWLLKPSTIQTVPDRTTGTVSINAGATTVTFSSAPASSVANQYMIQFTEVTDDWYEISAHTGGQTTATLAVPFVGSANISGSPYILRKVRYSLPSDLDRIVDIRQTITDNKLGAIDIRTFDRYLPDPTATGDPLYYAMVGLDSNKYWQITLYPIPDAIENILLRYLYTPADMTADGDTPVLPEKFHDILVFGALFMYGHPFIDDTRYQLAKQRFEMAIENMKTDYSPVPDQMNVIQPWDSRPRRLIGRLMYPPNFPNWGNGGY